MNQRLCLLSFLYLFLISASYLAAQCGVTHQDQALMKESMMRNRELSRFQNQESPQGIKYIPIRLILLAKSDGSSRVKPISDLLTIPCKLNECLKNISLEFYIKEVDTSLNSNLFFTDESRNSEIILKDFVSKKKDAINIFIINYSIGGRAYPYTDYTEDYIMFPSLNYVTIKEFLCHEIGHFLSLPHTYYGWGLINYNCSNPQYPNNVEYVNREHKDSLGRKSCVFLGDGFCDTQADYADDANFPITCYYSGCAIDPDGDSLITDKENYMSLFLNSTSCSFHYSNDQEKAMLNDFELSPRRNYLHTRYSPITNLPKINYISPINNQKLSGASNILLNWDDIPDVSQYLVEYSVISLNSTFKIEAITTASEWFISSLDPNKTYFWRVTPLVYPGTCTFNPVSQRFQTGSLINTKDINLSRSYSIYLNQNNNEISIKDSNNNLRVIKAYRMYSLLGQLESYSDKSTISINLDNYSSSAYVLTWLDESNDWNVDRFVKY